MFFGIPYELQLISLWLNLSEILVVNFSSFGGNFVNFGEILVNFGGIFFRLNNFLFV